MAATYAKPCRNAAIPARDGALELTMATVVEVNQIEKLTEYRREWAALLMRTPGASFFQSLEWLEAYWRHFAGGQKLRVFLIFSQNGLEGIVPLTVRWEKTRVGGLRVLNFPLHDWGSFYGPIGPDPGRLLTETFEHILATPRDWDILELRWQGGDGTNPRIVECAMLAAGLQCYGTCWDHTAVVDFEGTWESYWASRKGAWLRRLRHAERKLNEQGRVAFVRYRPQGRPVDDGSPRWDLYDACEEIARHSWQNAATNGTTLSHELVQSFLRETHEAAAAAGAVDLNLLLLDNRPAAFIYGYHWQGCLYGLRRGQEDDRALDGAGNVLLIHVLQDSFARDDRYYDLGTGSLESKRHFQTRLLPVLRFSHYPALALRSQVLRLKRWWQSKTSR